MTLATGEHRVRFVPAGEPVEQAVIDTTVALDAGRHTLLAVGEVTGDTTPLRPVLLDDGSTTVAPDEARVRFVHASPDAPAVDLVRESTGETVVAGLGFAEAATATVPAGQHTFVVRPSGAEDCAPLARFPFEAAGGAHYTAFVEGYVTPEDEPADRRFLLAFTRRPGERSEDA